MEPSTAPLANGASASTRKSVLVVEDELFVRLMLSEELREAGFDVIEAFNADEAQAILQSLAAVDMIVSDVRMPGAMDGIGLLKAVRRNFPTLPVIITSGHLEPTLATTDGATKFISKPYSLELVVKAVQDELAKIL